MKAFRITWNSLCVLVALVIGMRITPHAILNLNDIDRHSGVFRNAIFMASMQGLALVLLYWTGCFCLSSPRWRTVSTGDRIALSLIGIVFLLGTIASAITSHQYINHIHWDDLIIFMVTFLALAGPAIFIGEGHISLFEKLRTKRRLKKSAKSHPAEPAG